MLTRWLIQLFRGSSHRNWGGLLAWAAFAFGIESTWLQAATPAEIEYEATAKSLDQHPLPAWFQDAKVGVLVHWGLYSIPAWAPATGDMAEMVNREGWGAWFTNHSGAEWYANSIKLTNSPSWRHHGETRGHDFPYEKFTAEFNAAAARWSPQQTAELFSRAGAHYVILTAKHHDGFLLWPGRQADGVKTNYHSSRDLVGEMAQAVREREMRFGVYYSSGLDWTFNPHPITNVVDLFVGVPMQTNYVPYMLGHWREMIEKYRPSILWNDLGTPQKMNVNALLAYYYTKVPDGVVNDRFRLSLFPGEEPVHFDFRTPESLTARTNSPQMFEVTQRLGHSFGYNQQEQDLMSVAELVRTLADVVSKGGNLLVNVGLAAEGTVPEPQRSRLLALGDWLQINGEAVYGSRPWRVTGTQTPDGAEVRFTQKGAAVYAILWSDGNVEQVTLPELRAMDDCRIQLLGEDGDLKWSQRGDSVVVALPAKRNLQSPLALRISPQPISLRK